MSGAISPIRFGLAYHLQNPARWYERPEELYLESVEQAVWAEQAGFDSTWVSEHHFATDGYVASPLLFLAALASRTSRLRLATNVIVAPLHHPLRLAEDAAALAILSHGRFDLGIAVGYQPHEFQAFGQNMRHRGRSLEQTVAALRQAWDGTPVQLDPVGAEVPPVRVSPVPQKPPAVLIGGKAPAAIERAARIGDGYLPPARPGQTHVFIDHYLDTVRRIHGPTARPRLMCSVPALIAEDPERALAQIGDHVLYQFNEYVARGTYGAIAPFQQPQQIVRAGYLQLWDGAVAIRELGQLLHTYPQIEDLHWWARYPGEAVDSSTDRARYIAQHVLPALRRTASRPHGPSNV